MHERVMTIKHKQNRCSSTQTPPFRTPASTASQRASTVLGGYPTRGIAEYRAIRPVQWQVGQKRCPMPRPRPPATAPRNASGRTSDPWWAHKLPKAVFRSDWHPQQPTAALILSGGVPVACGVVVWTKHTLRGSGSRGRTVMSTATCSRRPTWRRLRAPRRAR